MGPNLEAKNYGQLRNAESRKIVFPGDEALK